MASQQAANSRPTRRAAIAAGVMLAGAALAHRAKPAVRQTSQWGQARLSDMVPRQFGTWTSLPELATAIVNPSLEAFIATLYSDTLTRSYVNGNGQIIMLSLAHGLNQNRDLQVHKPEVCYVAQGFQLQSMSKVELSTPFGELPSMHLVAKAGGRNEPITYWIRVGDEVVRGWLEQNLARVRQGWRGQVPDGLLVRASSISDDVPQAFALQASFINDMLSAIPQQYRAMFIGAMDA